jgi:RNA polymerase sigma factor (sigma-70 family)
MDTAWVRAAREGDPAALDAVVAEYLPLVYNIVRRSLRHSADVDDVAQETMLQLVRGVGSLRDPERLRSWVVAITVNQIRDHQRSAVKAPTSFDERLDIPDPGGEFVEHTLIQLDVSGQRRETQQAVQWLDPDHQELLALWWQEASGHLTRPELVDALQADSHHVAVRVGRMKEQLDAARCIVRVLARTPRCPGLNDVAYDWDGDTSSVWRKRFTRHIRECPNCDAWVRDLIPPERLLVGMALLPIPAAYAGFRASTVFIEVEPKATRRRGAHRGGKTTGMAAAKPIGIAFAAIAVVAAGAVAVEGLHSKQNTVAITTTSTGSALASTAKATPSSLTIPTISVSASPSASRTSGKPTVAPSTAAVRTTSAAPRTSAAPVVATTTTSGGSNSETAAQQVLDVINQARKQNGLKPYTMSSNLINSASAHNTRMENGCGLSHQCSGEAALGDRETAAGVQWTSAGENIGEGGPVSDTQSAIASMAVGLTNSMLAEQPPDDGHRLNILSSSYTEVGIAVTRDSSGTVWMTQDFAGDG